MLTVLPNSALSTYQDYTPTTVAGVPSLGSGNAGGALYPLGACYTFPAVSIAGSARGLFVVNSTSGALVGDFRADVGTGEELVSQLASDGDLEVMYVANNSGKTIERGQAVVWDHTNGGMGFVAEAPASTPPGMVRGVALFDIEDGKGCFIAKSGVVEGLGGAVLAAGVALIIDGVTVGAFDVVAAATGASWAETLEASTDGGLSRIHIRC